MRRLIQASAVALFAAGAFTFAGCNGPPGESYRRPVDQSQASARSDQWAADQLPANAGGSGVAGGGLSDPGQIQTGGQRPMGIPQPSAPLRGQPTADEAQDPQSDMNVQGQGTLKPGVTTETIERNLREPNRPLMETAPK